MKTFDLFSEWLTIIIALLAIVFSVTTILSLKWRKDREYRKRFNEFLEQKERVESGLKRSKKEFHGKDN